MPRHRDQKTLKQGVSAVHYASGSPRPLILPPNTMHFEHIFCLNNQVTELAEKDLLSSATTCSKLTLILA